MPDFVNSVLERLAKQVGDLTVRLAVAETELAQLREQLRARDDAAAGDPTMPS